jgi:hypothetical protein
MGVGCGFGRILKFFVVAIVGEDFYGVPSIGIVAIVGFV